MQTALTGFVTGLTLITAIGAQNAYLLRLGLARTHVALAVAVCAASDALLMSLGTAGVGSVVAAAPAVLEIVRWVGVAYLALFALASFRRAARSEVLLPSDAARPTARAVLATTLAFTYLNPHVYLDTLLLIGSLANQHGSDRWLFTAGAATASLVGFSALGFGARWLAPVMSRPLTWRILDTAIGVLMLLIAWTLARSRLLA